MQVKKIARLGLLLSLKESYLFVRNSLGLAWHPFKTLAVLSREKDRSQQLLILGWPAYVLFLATLFTWAGRRLLATTPAWGMGAKLMFSLGILGFMAVGSYISYWWMRLWRSR
ncbi:hypothetical protein COW80_00315 [Candidatus Beckwithbacteria bacterium CG22_combo_CG10-13_8_21_14_all_01_47_9]|uniref:Uncharacterized protein n=1 Tax=Candidatus Beckwithbacteria bacterium CG22_combo_CG10-13_8_21_14_all_01_47_9 TaxID=1974496 RepID=A0A2H0E3Q0_9BACT|nr:MAG: hypothetical protein COW80_00315 [Candidatus Beckwithbacteria bacterium CG22_combo_CG10-13_8_21_14_all_01_47_9]